MAPSGSLALPMPLTDPQASGLSLSRQCHFLSTYRRWWWRAPVTLSSRRRTLRHGPWRVLATKYSLDEGNKHVKWRALHGVAMTSLDTQQILVARASIDYVVCTTPPALCAVQRTSANAHPAIVDRLTCFTTFTEFTRPSSVCDYSSLRPQAQSLPPAIDSHPRLVPSTAPASRSRSRVIGVDSIPRFAGFSHS